ncbi:MAG: alanine:cation symporter family protein, partial [Selenomonas sp.]|nr:alanine:cation symporter family protein [Selenomonas sp.]
QIFRVKNEDGTTFRGGPAYYMRRGLNAKVLPVLFSISVILGNGVVYCMVQSNSIAGSFSGQAALPPLAIGAVLVMLVGLVIFGGIKRLSTVASYIVPFMAFAYIILALIVLVTHAEWIADMLRLIIESAFGVQQAAGGVLGYTVQEAFRYGVARGLFSNDAGAGTTPSMHAAANVKHPVNQGLSGMLGVFVTTIIVCSCTAFCILLSGALNGQLTGIQLTQAAFSSSFGDLGYWLVAAAMFLFGYTTLLANMYYGEVNTRYLFPDKKYAVTAYRIFALCLILFGSIVPVISMWEFADLFGALMVLFNVIALFRLSKYVAFALKDYQEQKKVSDTPMWDYDADIVERYRSRSQ